MAKTQTTIDWKNRITQYGEQPANQFLAHELNARRHPAKQREALRGSLNAVGWVAPVIVSAKTGKILDGHARIEEALSKNEHSLVPFVEVDVSENEERTILATFDPITGLATYEREALDALLREVDTGDAALQEMLSELAEREGLYLDGAGGTGEPADAEPQIDKAAELNKKWQVKPGDLWLIGAHRLLCGDSTKAEDVARVMAGEHSELLFTSPPYSDMRSYRNNANLAPEHLALFLDVWADYCDYLAVNLGLQFKDGAVVQYWDAYLQRAKDCGLKVLAWNVWDKTKAGSVAHATNMFMLTHEWIFVFGSDRKRLNRTIPNQLDKYEAIHGKNWANGIERAVRQQDGSMMHTTTKSYTHHQLHSVIQQTPELSDLRQNHPAMFPVGLPTEYIRAMTTDRDVIADSFCGSGTTLVAAQNLNRKCYAIEISPDYCAVILERMHTAFPALEIKRDG